MEEPFKKYDLTQGPDELKLYIHVVQQGMALTILPEDLRLTLAYNDQSAFDTIKKSYPEIPIHIIGKKGELKIKEIIDHLNFSPQDAAVAVQVTETPPVTKEKKLADFIHSTMLLAEEYVTDKEQRDILKKILKDIKINEPENQEKTVPPENPAAPG